MVYSFQNVETFDFTDRKEKNPHHIFMVNMPRMKIVLRFSHAENPKSIIVENKNYRMLLFRKEEFDTHWLSFLQNLYC